MPILNVNVKNKIATGDGQKIICGNSDYIVHFAFDEEWNAFTTKTMRIQHEGTYTDVVFVGTDAVLPIQIKVLEIQIGVFAGNLHTTTPAFYDCVKSILCDGGTPVEPTPEVYDQIMAVINGFDATVEKDRTVATIHITSPHGETEAEVYDGKSAYESAQDGGYTGTEAQFNSDLADVSNKADINQSIENAGKVWTVNNDGSLTFSDGGKIDTITINGVTFLPVNKDVNLGTVLREHQSLDAYRTSAEQDVIDEKHQLKPEYNEVASGTIETIVNNHKYTVGNFVMFGEGGYAKDSGESSNTLMQKQPTATRHNLASFETNGQAVDSGISKNALLFGGDSDILLKIVNSVEKVEGGQ